MTRTLCNVPLVGILLLCLFSAVACGAGDAVTNQHLSSSSSIYTITGSIAPGSIAAGVTVVLSGQSSATATADGSGNYSFGGLANGTYKVTPNKTGYTFTPATQSVVLNGATVTAINFTAAAGTQTVLFYDDFTSGALSADWTILNRPGDSSNNELECYTSNNVAIVGGVLQLTAKADSSCQGYNYTSGAVQWTSFNYAYGTIEIRAKMAGGQGTWPALWFLGHNCQTTNITTTDNVLPCNWPQVGSDEIDLVEIMKGSVTYYNPQVHSAGNSPECLIGPLADVSQNWHVYKTTWSAGSLVFDVDNGAQTCTISSNIPTAPMFLIMNVAVGGFGGGAVNNSTLPQTMYIDYVKVTQ